MSVCHSKDFILVQKCLQISYGNFAENLKAFSKRLYLRDGKSNKEKKKVSTLLSAQITVNISEIKIGAASFSVALCLK